MSEVTLDDALKIAADLLGGNRLIEAEALCRKILNVEPEDAEALHLLGKIAFQTGNHAAAADFIRKSIAIAPGTAACYQSLGIALRSMGQRDQAIESYYHALRLQPVFPEVHYNLGNLWQGEKEYSAAITSYERALTQRPGFLEVLNNLGNVFRAVGRFEEAISIYQRALVIQPRFADAHHNLGGVLQDLGRFSEAAICYQNVISSHGDSVKALFNLGTALFRSGNFNDAFASYNKVLALKPDHAGALMNLGSVKKDTGRLAESIPYYRRALELAPDSIQTHDNLLLALQYDPDSDPQSLHREALDWNRQHLKAFAVGSAPHPNGRDPARRLRIGYLSPDFGNHPIAWFMLPLLSAHDRTKFEIVCYNQRVVHDEMTAKLKSQADIWRDISLLSDEEIAAMVRQDGIDIFVNLAMHTAKNRLLVFARKPSPVQVAYLGYAGGTAVDAIDYRLSDRYLDPNQAEDRFYMEKTFRLTSSYWCYQPLETASAVTDLPALSTSTVTFCCLNNFCKTNPLTLSAWAHLLKEVPGSRLVLHCPEGSHRKDLISSFEDAGVAGNRVTLLDRVSRAEYLQTYGRVDIALDPFPFCGGTTTCDALWMGVPVITLAGKTPAGRAGVSILSNAGLPEFIAHSPEEYVQLAVDLALDLPRLANLRSTLRQHLIASPLMDLPGYISSIESAYRSMWQNYCDSQVSKE